VTRLRAFAERTDVPVDRSKAQIEKMLTDAGADSVGSFQTSDKAMLMFKLAGTTYRFMVPLPAGPRDLKAGGRGFDVEQRRRQRWRALALVIKAKLEAGRSGITSVETELLPYAVLPNGRTVADEALPALKQANASGRDVPLLPGL